MHSALPELGGYVCVDAVPESTFLCDYYLKFRTGGSPRVETIPLDQLDRLSQMPRFDLAVNVHSFTECSHQAIAWWIDCVHRLGIRRLFIVPNVEPEGADHGLFSIETDGSRREFLTTLSAAGYRQTVRAPKFHDPHLQNGIPRFCGTQYYLFEHAG